MYMYNMDKGKISLQAKNTSHWSVSVILMTSFLFGLVENRSFCSFLKNFYLRDAQILGWCSTGSVLAHEEVPL